MVAPAMWDSPVITRTGSVLTVHVDDSGFAPTTYAVAFLTRFTQFTEESLEEGWIYIDRVRMVGPWFDGDEVYLVLAAKYFATPPSPKNVIITEHVDIEGIPLDAPLIRGQAWFRAVPAANSIAMRSDIITGERASFPRLIFTMSGDWSTWTYAHVAQRDAAWLISAGAHEFETNGGILEELDYRKHGRFEYATSYSDPGNPVGSGSIHLRTRSTIKWADGTTENRTRVGADTQVQRIAFQFSTAPATPSKPTILGSSPQWINSAAPSTIALTYTATMAGEQAALAWKRTIGADVKYWNQTTQAWQATVFENVRSQPNTTFPAAAFPADSTFTIQVAAKGAVGGLSEYSDAVTLDTHPAPSGTITITPYDEVTHVTSSLSPSVSVGGTPAEGQHLDGYIVEVLNSEGQRFAYADVAGLSPWIIPLALPNNTIGWTARVRVRQSGGALSDWVSLPFDVVAVVPGVPAVTASATAHEVSELPLIRLTVDLPWETDGFDYAANTINLDVERSTDDGTMWTRVGAVTPLPGWASGITLDDEAPSHLPAWYRVRAAATTQYGGVLTGPWGATTTPVMAVAYGPWLSPIGFPGLAVPVDLVTAEEGKVTSGQGGTAVIGASHQVVTGVSSILADGGYVARTDTPDDEAALVSLLSGGHLLTMSMCPEKDTTGYVHEIPRRWFRAVGDISVARVVQGPWTMRLVSWTAVPQSAPAVVGE